MNKKGQFLTAVKLIIYAIFLTVVVITFWAMSNQYVKQQTDIRAIEAELFISQLLYAPYGILEVDVETLQASPLRIDRAKLTDEHLDKSFRFENNKILSAKVSLRDMNNNLLAEAFYNKVWYVRWKPIVGKGSGSSSMVTKDIIVGFDNNQGVLTVEVLLPNKT
jgi:hypothetical protein